MLRTLKGKISIVFLGLVFLIAVVGAISVLSLARLETSVNGMMSNNYRSIQACEPMLAALERQNVAVLSYIHNADSQSMDTFSDEDLTFQKYYNIEIRNITEKGEKDITERIAENYAGYREKITQLQRLRDTSDETAAFNYYHSTIIPVITSLNDDLNRIIALNQTVMLHNRAETSRSTHTSLAAALLITLAAVAAGFLLSRHYLSKFLHPLRQLTETVSRLKDGGFDQVLDVKTGDEIGELAAEFNAMTARLGLYEQSTKGQLMHERNQSVAIMKSISDPLLVLDERYRVVLINDACEAFFRITEEQALGRHFLESIPEGRLFDVIAGPEDEDDAETRQQILRLERKTGPLYLNVSVTRLKFDPAAGFIVLLHNVTDIKELEQAKTDFIATISHECKTPLTAVMMGASLLENGGMGPLSGRQLELVRTIAENAQRLTDFVSDLLELSRIESGKSIYMPEPCTLQAIAHNSVRQFEEPARRAGVTLTNAVRGELPPVFADFEKVTWVLNNLLSNALKYTGPGGSVSVDAAADEACVTVSVTDTGEGIPPEFLDRVFDKFVQVGSGDIEARGTGLGLSVAREIILAHGGRIWAESTLGEGSRFLFTLPLFKEDKP